MSDELSLVHRFNRPDRSQGEAHTSHLQTHSTWLKQAATIAEMSKDPSTKVGAVIVDSNGRCVGQGYNGFPRRIPDWNCYLNDRELKYKLMVHAEMNAILDVSDKRRLVGATMYLNTLLPCCSCTACIIQAGISKVYVPFTPIPDRWKDDMGLAESMLEVAGVTLRRVTYQ